MPRYLGLFVALVAPLLMALSCTVPTATLQGSLALCKALGKGQGCNEMEFYKSQRDGKWYFCSSILFSSNCMNLPEHRVTDQQGAILDAWLAGNTSGSSTPGVSDPVFTNTPSSTPPPTTPPPD